MDIKFIDIEDNRSAFDADSIEELFDIGIPANVTREFFVRLGNVSNGSLTNVPMTLEGDHPDRVQLSFNEFGSYSDSLTLDSLDDGRSKNLFIKVTQPFTVKDEAVTTYLVVGADKLPIRYQAASALNVLTDPYPLYDGDLTAEIFKLFANKPVHRFSRYEPVENPNGPRPDLTGKVKLKNLDFCEFLNPNNHEIGYGEPICKDLVCIPAPKELDSLERWKAEDGIYEYEDRSVVFLQPDFLNEMGFAAPQWRHFHTENSPVPKGSVPDLLGSPLGLERFKRTQFVMLRQGTLYSLEHLHAVMRGQELGYFKATMRRIYAPEGTNPWGYNPFAHVYEDGSDRVITRYPCWNLPKAIDVPGSTSEEPSS